MSNISLSSWIPFTLPKKYLIHHPIYIKFILATISGELREFFHKDGNNFIEFWNCSSNYKWLLHHIVDKETKKFNLTSIFSYRSFWDLSRKNECNTILNNWKMSFQVLYNKGQNFLELLDDNLKLIEPFVSKDGL